MNTKDYSNATSLQLKAPLLRAALQHVVFDGWSEKVLLRAAGDIGISQERAELVFPGKGVDLLTCYLDDVSRRHAEMIEQADLDGLKIREKIKTCLRLRFDINGENKQAVARAVSFMALPAMLPLAAKANWQVADIIWRGIGDSSTDHNYYTKRAILAAVYASSLLFWLQDSSADHEESWGFLDRRLEDVMKIEIAKVKIKQLTVNLPSPTRFLGRLRYGARP